MKAVIGAILFVIMTSQSFAYSLKDLEGSYRVSPQSAQISGILTIDNSQIISFVDDMGRLNCQGIFELVSGKITSDLFCTYGLSIGITIDISQVTNLNSFTAPASTTMTGEGLWVFERLNN